LLFSFNKTDPPEADLNFRHFAILGISLGNLIFTQKYLATKSKKIIYRILNKVKVTKNQPLIKFENLKNN